ncbi:DDE transposase [Caminibacter profundus]
MKKIILILFCSFLFASEFTFQISDINSSKEATNQKAFLNNENNLTFEYNVTNENNLTNENNKTKTPIQEITFEDNFISIKPNIKVCVLIDKKNFFKFTPSIINSLNAYLINKNVEYNISVFNIDKSLEEVTKECEDVLVYTLDKNYIKSLNEYNNTRFYIPVFHKKDIDFNTTSNIYFGGIDYKAQIDKLAKFIDDKKTVAINENTSISNKLFKYENELNLKILSFTYPKINYNDLNNSFIFFNTSAGKSAEILSNITYKEIETKLQLATQIDYDPLLIGITQPEDIKKLIVANSILNPPILIEDYNLLVNSDIKYNWLNYDSSILLNKIYNIQTNEDKFYMNDFKLYIFNNQVDYKTKLYQIINGAFKLIEN